MSSTGIEEGTELLGVVPPLRLRYVGQGTGRDNRPTGLDLPDDGELLAEVVLRDRRQRDQGAAGQRRGRQFV